MEEERAAGDVGGAAEDRLGDLEGAGAGAGSASTSARPSQR